MSGDRSTFMPASCKSCWMASSNPGKIRDTFIGLSTESAALGKKLGVEFPEDPVSYNLKVIDKLDPESTASMQKDLARGHDSEIQGLLFDMIAAAEEQAVS